MTGELLSGTEAADEGIVNHVHPAGDLEGAVSSLVKRLASKPPLAIRAVKNVVNVHQETGLTQGRRYERRVIDTLRGTADHEEGRRAFIEDREPEWEGR